MDRESLILWSEQTTLPCITTNKQNPVSRLYSNEQSQYLSNLIVSFDYIALLSEEKNKIRTLSLKLLPKNKDKEKY